MTEPAPAPETAGASTEATAEAAPVEKKSFRRRLGDCLRVGFMKGLKAAL